MAKSSAVWNATSMGWPYHFIDLDDAQRHERRRLLDYYGSLAQVSVLLPLLALQVYFAIKHARWKLGGQSGSEMPSSPHVKAQRGRPQAGVRYIRQTFNKLVWWCGDSCKLGGERLGTKGEVVGAVVWLVWLLVLSFVQTGDGEWRHGTVDGLHVLTTTQTICI